MLLINNKIKKSILWSIILTMVCFSGCGVSGTSNTAKNTKNSEKNPQNENSNLSNKVDEDFSFSLTWGVDGASSYNSTDGKLVKTKNATNPDDYITTYIMSEDDKKIVYDIIKELDVESYPDEYNPYDGGSSTPSATVILSVHTSNGEKTITAKDITIYDGTNCNNEKGQEFLNAVSKISDILTQSSEWGMLPDCEYYYD